MTDKLNRCYFQAASAGTGDFVYASTVAGFMSPTDAGAVDTHEFACIAENGSPPTEWELVIGAYDAGTGTVARTTIVDSSNAGAAVTFSAAPKVRMGVPLAADFGASSAISVTQVGGSPIIIATTQGSVQVGPTVVYSGPAIGNMALTAGTEEFATNAVAITGFLDASNGPSATLTTLDVSVLLIAGADFNAANCSGLTTLDASALTRVGAGFDVSGCSTLTALDLSSLVAVGGGLSFGNCTDLNSLDISALTSVGGGVAASNCTSLTALDMSALASIGGDLFAFNCSSLVTLDVSSLATISGDFFVSGCALDQATVDAALVKLASLDGTGGTTTYDGHTVDLSGGTNASPGVTGLAAKLVLEGRGNTVSVN